MALLHYENLGVHRPDVLMQRAFYGLKAFYDFLSNTKRHVESDAAVKRLAWQIDDGAENGRGASEVWVRLVEPEDRPNEPETTFREFLADDVREVYEVAEAEPARGGRSRSDGRLDFSKGSRIAVLDRDPETDRLLLGRRPEGPGLMLRPNTWPLHCQIQALRVLQNAPSVEHLPLLRLFESVGHTTWPTVRCHPIGEAEWMVLTDGERPGTDEQRRFVEVALATPDFAFLEGPPGSGKTTAICELVLQLVREGKRVLLCASTHVAVDNVLERVMDERNAHRDLVIPVRVGDRRNVSDKARPWQLEEFVRTERERLLSELRGLPARSASQEAMLAMLRHGPSEVERIVLDAANLVCGTTIGILQHPDIKAGNHLGAPFDVLVVDEASKTTFQEFLVPAMLAKRWVIVGDPKQLSPYVDDDAMAVNVEACLPDEEVRNACVDVFYAGQRSTRRRRSAVAVAGQEGAEAYLRQGEARGVAVAEADAAEEVLAVSSIVVGAAEQIEGCEAALPLDVATVRAPEGSLPAVRRRAAAWLRLEGRAREDEPTWASEVGWRLARLYEQRLATGGEKGRRTTADRLGGQIEALLPADGVLRPGEVERVREGVDRVRRVALPSILESLRYGFERDERQRVGTALSDGLPERAIAQRHVLLRTQHRMHEEIAAISHTHVYDGEALVTPAYIGGERAWEYTRYAHRAVWLDVPGEFKAGRYNSAEARAVRGELEHFDAWARHHPRSDGRPWEVAVLTFYRGQEKELRRHLQEWSKQRRAMRHFSRGASGQPYLAVALSTVDRFQGHEADFVLISVANTHTTSFLESPNRVNVALTRARYQRVVVGHRKAMGKAGGSLLGVLANERTWETSVKWETSIQGA